MTEVASIKNFEARTLAWKRAKKHWVMQVMAPNPLPGWEAWKKQDIILDEQLEDNVDASFFFPGAYWIHQQIKEPVGDVTFLTIFAEFIWKKTETLEWFYRNQPTVFAGRQRAIIGMWVDKRVTKGFVEVCDVERTRSKCNQDENGNCKEMFLKTVSAVQVVLTDPLLKMSDVSASPLLVEIEVYPVVTGPRPQDVRWFKGAGLRFTHFPWEHKCIM